MFDERRRFTTCVFCGSDPGTAGLTAEHVFGKWLASRFQERFGQLPNWLVAGERFDGKGGGPILSIAPRLACHACNHGPLSREAAAAIEPVWRAIVGESHDMTVAEQVTVQRYLERVGIIVDVMTSDHQLCEEQRKKKDYLRSANHLVSATILIAEQRAAWTAGASLNQIQVAIGHHAGVLGVNPQTLNAPLLEFEPAQRSLNMASQRFLTVIGHLAVCVQIGSDPRPLPHCMRLLSEQADLCWPPARAVTYADFYSMANRDPRNDLIVRCMSDPTLCSAIEAHTRATKQFDVPPEAGRHLKRILEAG